MRPSLSAAILWELRQAEAEVTYPSSYAGLIKGDHNEAGYPLDGFDGRSHAPC
jgi:hypothetical protein